MRRRQVLVLGIAGLAGCSTATDPTDSVTRETPAQATSDRSKPPAVDCSDASRPTVSADRAGDGIELQAYPAGPPPLEDQGAVREYIATYERAYTQRAALRDTAGSVGQLAVDIVGTRTYVVAADGAVVRVRYEYALESERDGSVAMVDSPAPLFATYYVDDSLLVRAEGGGVRADETALAPDPWTTGEPVACFGSE